MFRGVHGLLLDLQNSRQYRSMSTEASIFQHAGFVYFTELTDREDEVNSGVVVGLKMVIITKVRLWG